MDPEPNQLIHGTFVARRTVSEPPARVFAAFSDLRLRRQWFRIPGQPGTTHHELDFRVGGREVMRGTFAPKGVAEQIEYRAEFLDILESRRIVFVFELLLDERRRSLSLVTLELDSDGPDTRITRTEQYIFLALTGDGRDDVGEREGGTRLQLNSLAAFLEAAA